MLCTQGQTLARLETQTQLAANGVSRTATQNSRSPGDCQRMRPVRVRFACLHLIQSVLLRCLVHKACDRTLFNPGPACMSADALLESHVTEQALL
jgi:hypothetical protein